MMKVHEKVNGNLRNENDGQHFCEIRSIISSARKQSRALLDSLGRLLTKPVAFGEDLAGEK